MENFCISNQTLTQMCVCAESYSVCGGDVSNRQWQTVNHFFPLRHIKALNVFRRLPQ